MEIVKTNTAEENIRVVRPALEAVNTGDTNKIHEVISPKYFNHESQVDPVIKASWTRRIHRYSQGAAEVHLLISLRRTRGNCRR